jgi:hypothetical protein
MLITGKSEVGVTTFLVFGYIFKRTSALIFATFATALSWFQYLSATFSRTTIKSAGIMTYNENSVLLYPSLT